MPWNMQDYPNSFKNLPQLVRKKAIDIANALLADGYPDARAIPIALSQAKKWYDDATEQELAEFKREPNPKKTDKHQSDKDNSRLLDADTEVKPSENGWKVQTKGAKRASDTFDKKTAAVKRAKEIAANKESAFQVYGKDGKKQRTIDM